MKMNLNVSFTPAGYPELGYPDQPASNTFTCSICGAGANRYKRPSGLCRLHQELSKKETPQQIISDEEAKQLRKAVDILSRTFIWDRTPEGEAYWRKLTVRLNVAARNLVI